MNNYNLRSKVLEILLSKEKTFSIYSRKTLFGPVRSKMSALLASLYIYHNCFFLLFNFFFRSLGQILKLREDGHGCSIIFKLMSLSIQSSLKMIALNAMKHF